jgi:hypothetical protein
MLHAAELEPGMHAPSGPRARGAPQEQDAVEDALDNVGRVLQRLEPGDVLGRDAVERGQRRVQRRLRARQVALRVVLDRRNLLRGARRWPWV